MVKYRFAERVAQVAPPITLAPAVRNLVKLSVGNGSPRTLPDLTAEAALALTDYRNETLQYGSLYGIDALRDGIAGFLAADGVAAARDDVLVVNGGKQALELIARAFLDPGDAVVVTAPTFVTALSIFALEGATFIPVGINSGGMLVADLEAILRERRRNGIAAPKLVFEMPEFHNPAGVTLSLARRERLVQLAGEYDFLIIEDDPYRRIRFSGSPVPTLRSLDRHGRVLGVGTMAKILAAGLKIGWVNAAPEVIRRLGAIKMDGGSSPLTQRIVALLLENGRMPEIVGAIAREMHLKRDALAAGLARHLPEASFRLPEGGYFLWVEMPAGTDCDALADLAVQHGVSVFSGTHCYASGPKRNFLRVCYSVCTPEELDEGASRLAAAYKELSEGRESRASAVTCDGLPHPLCRSRRVRSARNS